MLKLGAKSPIGANASDESQDWLVRGPTTRRGARGQHRSAVQRAGRHDVSCAISANRTAGRAPSSGGSRTPAIAMRCVTSAGHIADSAGSREYCDMGNILRRDRETSARHYDNHAGASAMLVGAIRSGGRLLWRIRCPHRWPIHRSGDGSVARSWTTTSSSADGASLISGRGDCRASSDRVRRQ